MNINQKLIQSMLLLQDKTKKMNSYTIPVHYKYFQTHYFNWKHQNKIQMFLFKGKFVKPVYSAFSFIFLYAYENNIEIQYSFQKKAVFLPENDCLMLPRSSNFVILSKNPSAQLLLILIEPQVFIKKYFYYFSSDVFTYKFYLDPSFQPKIPFLFQTHKDPVIRLCMQMLILLYTEEKKDLSDWDQSFYLLLQLLKKKYIQRFLETANVSKEEKILHYIDLYSKNLSLQQCSDYFMYHPVYLSTYVKKSYHLSFEALLHYFRLKKAKLLIEFTDLSLEEISKMVGYHSYVHFHRYYKKIFLHSPAKKRKK